MQFLHLQDYILRNNNSGSNIVKYCKLIESTTVNFDLTKKKTARKSTSVDAHRASFANDKNNLHLEI